MATFAFNELNKIISSWLLPIIFLGELKKLFTFNSSVYQYACTPSTQKGPYAQFSKFSQFSPQLFHVSRSKTFRYDLNTLGYNFV